ncbi:MAG: hypothetical protein ACTH1O_01615 [Brachybacterium sp.]
MLAHDEIHHHGGTGAQAPAVYLVIEIIRVLIVFAVPLVGALMSRRWAKQNA